MPVPEVAESFAGSVNRITLGATKDDGGTRSSTVTIGGAKNVVYGGSPDATDPAAYFAFNQGQAWADPFFWAPLQIAGSIGMLLGQQWGFLLALTASAPFWYSAILIFIWDRDLGFRAPARGEPARDPRRCDLHGVGFRRLYRGRCGDARARQARRRNGGDRGVPGDSITSENDARV